MKKSLLLLAFAAFIVSTGCQKIKSLANINADVKFSATDTAILPANLADSLKIAGANINVWINLPSVGFPTYAAQNLDSFHIVNETQILAVTLKQLSIQLNNNSLTNTNRKNFGFIDSVTVTLSTLPKVSVLYPPVQVAYKYGIDPNSDNLSFDLNTTKDLKGYFVQDTIYISLKAHFVALPPDSTSMQFLGAFHILANPLD